ncbi:MAG: TetR family transcriptional regulator [Trueperaceae bacterium]
MNMRSAKAPPAPADDRSTPARIRDAALVTFAEAGFRAATVRAIAERAGVSPALVIHHYGSKERLREACDAFVTGFVRERKVEAMRAGPGLDPLALLRDEDDRLPLLAYLARALQDGSPAVATLVDEMIADAEAVLAAGAESGLVRPLDHPRGVAAVLTLWSLGALVLHEHARRILGVDLTGPMSNAALSAGYMVPAMEILTHGLVAPGMYERLATAAEAAEAAASAAAGSAPTEEAS